MRIGWLGAMVVGLVFLLGVGDAAAQICDRDGYVRHGVDCPNAARDATGCCPRPRPVVREPCAVAGQVRSAATAEHCCWPGQRWRGGPQDDWRDLGCSGTPTRCPLGWALSEAACQIPHESVRSWDYPEALGSSPRVSRRSLEAAFGELGLARRHRDDAPDAAAGHYEAAVEILERAGHRRAYVFRYHAASAWELAGERERASARLAAYLAAGGADPPSFDARRPGFEVRLEAWRSDRLWPTIAPIWELLEEQGPAAATPEALDALVSAARAADAGAHADAAAAYDSLQSQYRVRGAPVPQLSLRAAEAWAHADRRNLAAERYGVYLALGGEDPPGEGVAVIAPRVRASGRSLQARWRSRFEAGVAAAEAGEHEDALAAFEASFARVEGHPARALGLLAVGRSQRALGEPVAALSTFSHAARLAAPGMSARADAAVRAASGTLAAHFASAPCAVGPASEVACLDGAGGRFVPMTSEGQALRAFRLTASHRHVCALTPRGRVQCWGSNAHGQLGDGTGEDRSHPVQALGLAGIVDLAAGGDHTCALRQDGAVLCWGRGSLGQLGDGGRTSRSAPSAPVVALSDAVRVAAGLEHTCALRAGGSVACWGSNESGQSGAHPGLREVARPVVLPQLDDVVDIAAGARHTCGLRSNGEVYCWGENRVGQLGHEARQNRFEPVHVVGVDDAVQVVAGGSNTCVRLRSGGVRCWGSLVLGGEPWDAPREVGGLEDVLELAAARVGICSRHEDGRVRCWRLHGVHRLDARARLRTYGRVDVVAEF